jgi:dTMP kinase
LLPDILLHGAAPRAELLAFTIARAQLVDEVILPHLKNKNIVVCDRYADSTTAYQGYGRGLDLKLVEVANTIATRGLKPNLTVLLDIPAEEGLARKWGSDKSDKTDHFEKQIADVIDFHRRVREGYLKIAASEPERWLVIDARQSRQKIAQIVWDRVSQLL